MHTTVSLKPRGLKMSVCSDFVEHVWKPGSCKNCFHPRGSHGLQQGPPKVQAGGGGPALLQGLHGILRNKSETLQEDDGSVTASPYSKPTIAVKPTMISSEVSDAWSETAMTAESIPQVSWRKISPKHPILKTEEAHRTFFEHFGNSREPFNHIATSVGAPQHAPGYSTLGLHSPDRKVERNLSSGSGKGASDLVGHDDKAHFLCKEKVTTTQGTFTQETTISTETRAGFTTDSAGYFCIQAREDGIFSVSAKNGCSTSLQADGGDYCQIATYSTDGPVAHEASALAGRRTWRDGTGPAMGLCIQNFIANSRANGKSGKESTLMNSQLGHQEDHCVLEKLQNRAGSSWKKAASLPQLASVSDISPRASNMGSPLASPQEGDYYRLSGELEPQPVQERSLKIQRNLPNSTVADAVKACKDEPIYAESTKRKKVLQESAKSDGLAYHGGPKQGSDYCGDRALYCNSNQSPQDSSTQVTAKITVMAAHTEEDNRTIYLSSPDSAVSIQWSCISPASSQEFSTLSPSFQWLEGSHGIKEMGRVENAQVSHTPGTVKSPVQGNPSVPPKIFKNGQLACEQSDAVFDSSPIDRTKPEATSALPSSRNTPGASAFRNSSARSPQRPSAEEQDKSVSPVATERRHKYYTAAWSRQGRIEEEEEEEALSQQTKAQTAEPRPASSTHTNANPTPERAARMGMSKSASCPYVFARDRMDSAEIPAPPPPPPPKKHLRPVAKKNKSDNCEPEQPCVGSVGSLASPSQALNVSFITGSTDSLSSTRTCSDGGQSNEGIHSPAPPHDIKKPGPTLPSTVASTEDTPCAQPPPLPQKRTVSRTASAPDNTFWGQTSLGHRILSPTSPRMNTSQSESNVFHHETGQFSCPSSPGDSQHLFSSCESLEKACRGHGHRTELRSGPCFHSRAANSLSSSQLNMTSSHGASGSSLQLHHLLSNIDSKEGMYAKLGGLYAESLRRLVAKCEDCFMHDQKTELCFNENSWSLFKLTCNKPCCDAGDAIYYCATCAKDPQHTYAVKICKPEDSKTPLYCSLSLPVHFNIQQDCGHFQATVPSSMSQSTKTLNNSAATNGAPQAHASSEQECVVVITREVPHQTAADFVKDSSSTHNAQPELYERQVCFLLLQLCNGLEHLKEHGIIHRDLCLENLLFAHCQSSAAGRSSRDEKRLPRLIISNFSKAKQRSGANNSKLKRDQARLAPEIVSASQYKKFDEFQTGILIYELLHQPNPFEVRAHLREQEYSQSDLPPVPNLSLYSKGLQRLAHLLLEADPIKRIRITEAKRVLQCLLWGPRKDLADQPFIHEEALHGALQNWIDMKRALLMMKFAERAVDPERGIELEDWLCCQYLASTDPCFLYHTLRLLHLL